MKKLFTDSVGISSVLVIAGLLYFNSSLIIWSMLISWIFFNCASLISHEGWAHDYIRPKNKFFSYFLDLIGYLTFLPSFKAASITPKVFWKFTHILHHKSWKDEDDLVQWGLDHNHWLPYTFTSSFKKYKRVSNELWEESTKCLHSFSPAERFIDKNFNILLIFTHLLVIAVAGVEYYFYFMLVPCWVFSRTMVLVGEVIPHYKKSLQDEKDAVYLFPLICGNAYHTSHHKHRGVLFIGNGWKKYVNIQYYFMKLFYNIRPGVLVP